MNRIFAMVPKAGLEPARAWTRLILSQVRLPIPPLRHFQGSDSLGTSNIILGRYLFVNSFFNFFQEIFDEEIFLIFPAALSVRAAFPQIFAVLP